MISNNINFVPVVFVSTANCEMPYSQFVDALFKHDMSDMENMHAALGITGEAGEIADTIKKSVIYGKPFDRNNIIEELGDLRFYMQALMTMHRISEDEVLQGNADKLGKRYPTGSYSNQDAIARADKEQISFDDLEDTPLPNIKDIDINNISDWFPTGYDKVFFSPSKACYCYHDKYNKPVGPFSSISNAKAAIDAHIMKLEHDNS